MNNGLINEAYLHEKATEQDIIFAIDALVDAFKQSAPNQVQSALLNSIAYANKALNLITLG